MENNDIYKKDKNVFNVKRFLNKTIVVYITIIFMMGTVLPSVRSDVNDPWWNQNWIYRKEINIDYTKVDANLKNFPVLINLTSDTSLVAHAQPDGDDIVFTDAQGIKFNHEIELYNSATGRLVAWVNVTSLSATIDTRLYIYYGNGLCSSQQNPSGTWNADYLFVHHMNETGTIYDSTSHGYSATNTGTTTEPNGKIDGSRYFDSTADRYDFGTATGLNPGMNSWTISLWTKIVHVDAYQMLRKWGSSTGLTLYLYNGGGTTKYNYIKVSDGAKSPYRYWDASWSDGNWHYINAVINRNTNKIDVYLDGTLHNGAANTDLTGMGSITTTANFLLYGGTNGRHDEFSISTVVRNASWIKTCYNNQNNPASFYSLGIEEQRPSGNLPAIQFGENPADNSVNVNINIPSVSVTIQDPEGSPINWTIITSPNVGSSSGNNEFNGTKSCSITGLIYSTVYTWTVKANDGNTWTNKTYTFTIQVAPVNNPPIVTSPNPTNMSAGVPISTSSLSIMIRDLEGDHFNWIITTSPNIGSNSGTGATNGTKSCTISGLIYSTTYTWTVRANDGHTWTNKTYTFTTQAAPNSWWNQNWIYRKEINIDHAKVDANLKNFPVLINLTSDTSLAAHAQPDGDDIVFTDAQGNKLNHEIELYNTATGRLVAWVNVTSLSSYTDTKLYVYYGNSLCSSQQNQQSTWNADYLFVHHMNETGTIYDSTSHGYSATNTGTTTEPNGKIDGSRYFDSTADRYDFGTATGLNPGMNSWTISLWTKIVHVDAYQMLRKWGSSTGLTLYLYNGGGTTKYNYIKVSDGVKSPYRYWDTSWSDGNWHYINAVINRNTNKIDVYLDGTLHNGAANTDLTGLGSITTTANFLLYGGTNGRHDEFSISTVVRNASWIKTCYNNQNNPASFYSLGIEEQEPSGNLPTIQFGENPADNSVNVNINIPSVSVTIQDPEGSPINWTIITSPNVGSSSGNNEFNGTKSCSITGLIYSTVYTWTVKANDGNTWTNKTYTFTTRAPPVNNPPILSNPIPTNGSTSVMNTISSLSITIQDPEGDHFNWRIRGKYVINVSQTGDINGTKTASLITPLPTNTTIVWYVNVTDPSGSKKWTNATYHFTTKSIIPTLKWTITSLTGMSAVSPLVADVNADGVMDIIRSGANGIVVYDGATGNVVWTKSVHMWSDHVPMEIIDLDKDGIPEIISSHENGTWALHGNDGSIYWYNPDAPLHNKHAVAGDINADGYPEIYVCRSGSDDGSALGSITALTHDGQIFASTSIYYPCFSGLSLGDTNYDGVFELYLNERNYGYHGNTVGEGVRAFWASNLTQRWSHPEMLSSSHCPTLVDVNKDGILDVVSLHQGGGIGVFNSADGSVIHQTLSISGMGCHSQPTIYDVDGDGNLELIASRESQPIIWDLYSWTQDAILPYGCFEPPAVADVTGDGKVEILACHENNISIYSYNNATKKYDIIGTIPITNPGYYGMAFIVAQDVDNDNLTELVFNRGSGLYVYDTIGASPTPRALSQIQFYSQHRGRSPYYVQYEPLSPIIKDEKPLNENTNQLCNPTLSVNIYDYQNQLMNITFSTNASTGIWHTIKTISNVHEGTYTTNTTEMNAAGTTYWWKATASDNVGNTRSKIYKFTTIPSASWWNADWNYRKEITIDHLKVDKDLKNFPILINLQSDTNIAAHAQPDGDDIVFTDAQGNKLNHEIELYNSATGRLVVWINVTSLSSSTNTMLYLYYGNNLCSSQQNPPGTWNANYLFVHHMNETGNIYDSTSHGYSATNYGTTTEPNGKIDGSRYFDTTTDRYDFGTATGLNPGMNSWTISLWTKITHVDAYQMLRKWGSNAGFTMYLYNGGGTTRYNYIKVSDGAKSPYRYWDASWSDGNWHYINAVINRNTNVIDVYLDGTLHNGFASGNLVGLGSITTTANFLLYGGTNGRHDEFSISTTVRNSSWIKTCYNNQNDPSSFYNVSNEKNAPGEPFVLNENPQDGETNVLVNLSQLTFTLKDNQGDQMSYTVTTNPDIGSGSGTGVSNGNYTVPISGLTMDTNYIWYVNVTDGTYWTHKVFSFSTGFSVDSWAYRKKITINKQGEEQCRIYAIMSDNLPNGLLKNDLITQPNSIKKLAPSNPDGWGIGYYPTYGSTPTIVRGKIRANNDPAFDATVEQINSSEPKITLAHIRKCTNGCCDSGSDSIDDPHPFVKTKNGKTWTFVHNGGIDVNIGKNLLGSTYLTQNPLNCSSVCALNQNCDSEVYFFLLLKNIENNSWNVTNGIVAAIKQLTAAGGDTGGLNFVLSDGNSMWAFRRHSLSTHTLYYLYDSVAGYTAVASQYPSSSQGNWVAFNDYELAILKPNTPPQIINVLDYIPTITEFTNFPVLIDIVDSDLATKAQDAGNDILFTDLNFQRLDFEIESYNATNGRLVAWVKIPMISIHSETEIYLYYGNENIDSQANPQGVWDSHYMMVQHLEETSGLSISDSTVFSNNGVAQNGVILNVDGKVDGADQFDGSNDYSSISDSNSLDGAGTWNEMTGELWVYLSANQLGSRVLSKRIASGSGTDKSYQIGFQTAAPANRIYAGVYTTTSATYKEAGYNTPLALNTWYHVTFTYKSSTGITLFINGAAVSTTSASGTVTTSTQSLCIGSTTSGAGFFNGKLDEARISDIARDRNWTLLSFKNQNDTSGFIRVGDEESSSNIILINQYPENGATDIPLMPTLRITAQHTEQYQMNITWKAQINENWTVIGTNASVSNGTYSCSNTSWVNTYNTIYSWKVVVNDGHGTWYNKTFSFTTLTEANLPPTQSDPLLVSEFGTDTTNEKLICSNQSTSDPNGDTVYNTYHWIKNGTSLTNLLLSFNTNTCDVCSNPVIDYSGYHNNGTVTDALWTSSGVIGGAYNFYGSDSQNYITIPDNPTIDGDGTWTEMAMECWVKSGIDNQKTTSILGKWMTNQPRSYQLGFDSNGNSQLFAAVETTGGYLETLYSDATPLVTGTWYHVVATYQNGVLNLYINGILDATKSNAGGTITGSTVPLRIGCRDNADGSGRERFFDGTIDEVKIYPFALTAEQIHQNYLESTDGLSTNSTIVPEETSVDDVWQCDVTPSDGQLDGITKTSNPLTIVSTSGYTLGVTIDGSGTVTKNPNKATYSNGEIVQLTATANPDWVFDSWSGNLTGSQNPINITMNSNKTVIAHFIQPNYNDIVFNSNFDQGNLIDVQFQDGDSSGYRFYTARNNYTTLSGMTDKHWWFYFSMENIASKTITVTIANGTASDYSTNPTNGNRWPEIEPVFSYDNINWERIPLENVSFDRTARTFTMTIKPTQNKIWLAPLPPYPVWRRDALFTEYATSPYLTVSSLGTTPGGQQLKVATITDPTYNDTNKFKAYVIAQQHAGEIPGSWNAEGMIRFLLSDNITAQAIRRSYIFKIIPITNVDGVYYGRCRYTPLRSGAQYDLNRLWNNPDTAQPEINWIFHDMESWHPDSFNDLHSTINTEQISPRDALTYSWSTSDPTIVNFMNKIKDGGWPETVRAVSGYACSQVHSQLGVQRSVSFENPHDELKTMVPLRKLTVNDWMNWGSGYVKGVYLDTGDAYGTLTVTSVGNGVVSKNPNNANYIYGTSVQLTATADPGWIFGHWSGNLTGSDNPANIIINGNLTVQAHFNLENTYTITASAGIGGVIDPVGSILVVSGADQSFTISTDTGYHIFDVLVDDVSVGAVSSYTFIGVVADHTIAAQFEEDIVYYSIIASAGVGGIITPSGSIQVVSGADQGFTISADAGYHILDVLVDGGSVGPVFLYTFTGVTADHTIEASFAVNQYTIIASAGVGGIITPSGSILVTHGADQNFTITANAGYYILDVLVDGGSVGAVSSYTFTTVIADHTIQAQFAENPLRLWMPFSNNTLPIPDASGYGNVGTLNGASWQSIYGGAYSFDGTNDYVSVTDNPTLDGSGSWNKLSIEFWVRPDLAISAGQRILRKGPSSGTGVNSYQVGFQTTGGRLYFDVWHPGGAAGAYYEVEYTTTLSASTWYHVVCVFESGVGSKIYVNGVDVNAVKVGTGSESGNVCESHAQPLYIGCRYHSTNGPEKFFDGFIDDVRIYSEALTPMVAQQRYESTKTEHANYTLTETIVGSGAVTRTPNLPTYAYGSSVQLSASPSAGYEFAGWSGNLSGNTNPATITMDGNKAVTATFTQMARTIVASADVGGSISPSGSVVVLYGADQGFAITADTGYHILDVLVDGGSVGAVSLYTFTTVIVDHTIQAQFAENPLRLWMPFNDATLPIPDQSGYGNSGTPYGNAAWTAGYGGCYNFDGNGDYVKINSTPSIDGGWNEITIEHWVKFSANNNGVKLVSKRGSASAVQSYQAGFQTSGPANVPFFGLYLSSGYGEWTSDISLQNSQWYHLAFTWVSSTAYKLYINGVEDTAAHFGGTSNKIIGPIKTSTGEPLYIGTRLVTAPYFNGLVDDVRIYSTALSPAVILQHYTEGVVDHIETYTITASAGTGGIITPSGSILVTHGADQGFAITADSGYHIFDVLVDGGSVGAATWYNFTNVNSNHNIEAQFEIDVVYYTITASAGTGGTINPSGNINVLSGGYQNFSISPSTGYHIQDVLVDSVSVGAVTFYNFTNVIADHSIAASFTINTYTITASANTGGTITPNGAIIVNYGGYKNFTIAPNTGYLIHDVLVDSTSVGAVSYYNFTNVIANHTIQAQFAENPLRLWMPFNDATLPIPDQSGYGNSGTPYGNAAWTAGYGGCYNLDGNGDYVQINSNPSIDGGWNEITIEHWVKFSANNNGVKLVSKRGSASALQSYQAGFQTSGPANVPFFGLYLSSGYGEWTSDISLQNSQWYHLAFTWVSSTAYKLYINGVEDTAAHFGGTSNKIIGPIKTSTGEPLYIGTRLVTAPYFNGLVDDVRIYSTALSPAVILQHYTEGVVDHIETYTITASAGTGGIITPSGSILVTHGADQGFTITADSEYHILDVLVDSISVGGVSYYNFTNVVADHAIESSFALNSLLIDSMFNDSINSTALRTNGAGQDWYESRQDTANNGPNYLTLDESNVAGNTGKKAKITGTLSANTYISQEFSTPQTGTFDVQWDIYVDEILDRPSSEDRGAFMCVGDDADGQRGPCSTGGDRFVYLAFVKDGGATSGPVSLVRKNSGGTSTVIGTVNLDEWYTFKVTLNLISDTYDLYVYQGSTLILSAMSIPAATAKTSVTHVSFSSWNDGAATFYIDNVYSPAMQRHRLTTDVIGQGLVIVIPGESTYSHGQSVQLTAVPASGWVFDAWSGALSGNMSSETLIMNSDKSVTATFSQITHTIIASAGSSGSISPSGSVSINYGEYKNFTITPDTGYHILDVLVDSVSVGAVPCYNFTNVIADHIIEASFFIITDNYAITITCTEPGGGNDYVIFGEAPDANDGPPADSYDILKPPAPPTPYLRVWFNDNLPTPYSQLGNDIRHFPGNGKVWNLTILWVPEDYESPTDATISWNPSDVDDSEYASVNLCNDTGTPLKNMLLDTNYTFLCLANVPQHFKIIASTIN